MKLGPLIPIVGILTLSTSFGASTVNYSASASPSSNLDANSNTVNVWNTSKKFENTDAGFFQGNSGSNGDANGAGAGSAAWALYAHTNNEAYADHTFAGGALSIGQTVGLDFDNGYFQVNDKSAGIQLRNGTTLVFAMYFRGGQTFYEYYDLAGGFDQDTTKGFTDDGANFSFKLNTASTYSATFGSAAWTGTIDTLAIDNIRVYNNSAGNGGQYNVFANNLTVVPEPTAAALGLLGTVLLLRRRRR